MNRVDLPTFGRPTIPNFISNTLLTRSQSIKPLRPRPSGEASRQGRDGEGPEHNNTSIIIRKAGRERKRKKKLRWVRFAKVSVGDPEIIHDRFELILRGQTGIQQISLLRLRSEFFCIRRQQTSPCGNRCWLLFVDVLRTFCILRNVPCLADINNVYKLKY